MKLNSTHCDPTLQLLNACWPSHRQLQHAQPHHGMIFPVWSQGRLWEAEAAIRGGGRMEVK